MSGETEPCPFHGTACEYVPLAHKADALQAEVERLKAALIAALGTYDTALSAATFTKPRTGQVILNVKTVERLNETLRAALKGAPHE